MSPRKSPTTCYLPFEPMSLTFHDDDFEGAYSAFKNHKNRDSCQRMMIIDESGNAFINSNSTRHSALMKQSMNNLRHDYAKHKIRSRLQEKLAKKLAR